ncbi:MAG: hypothetical protein P1R58_12545 [bacterium]|nr:hypothetical protein [bacterium]
MPDRKLLKLAQESSDYSNLFEADLKATLTESHAEEMPSFRLPKHRHWILGVHVTKLLFRLLVLSLQHFDLFMMPRFCVGFGLVSP